MQKNSALAWAAAAAIGAAIVVLIALTVSVWPPEPVVGLLLIALFVLPAAAAIAMLARQRKAAMRPGLSAKDIIEMSDDELYGDRLQALADLEQQLELRELRLARRLRTAQLASEDHLDLLETEPSDEELSALVEQDRKLLALVENESQLAFDRILTNRYAADDGVNSALILADVREFVEKVAKLYRPDADDVLLDTDIELIAKGLSSVSLHLLMVVDNLPLNLKSYNTAGMYRLIRRGASYYGAYKAFRPYLEQGLNTLQIARLAVGANPVAVGTAWLAGKLATRGAKLVGERLLQRTALQLLNDFIRVIGFEAAMMYGGGFPHRDANWVFAAELVNLEISRGTDCAGRDAALEKLCSLVLRNEFDRVHLLTQLSRHKPVDVARVRPLVVMTYEERESVASELARHCRDSGVDGSAPAIIQWHEALKQVLGLDPGITLAPERGEDKTSWIRKRFRTLTNRGNTDST